MLGETAADRRVYAVTGADRLSFLQGMVSNDVLPLGRGDGMVWAALLTPQGKYLADFLLVAQGDRLLLDIKDQHCRGDNPPPVECIACARCAVCSLISDGYRAAWRAAARCPSDPRHPALGWRGYGAAAERPRWTGTPSASPIASPSGIE